jgi:hypothetical protein
MEVLDYKINLFTPQATSGMHVMLRLYFGRQTHLLNQFWECFLQLTDTVSSKSFQTGSPLILRTQKYVLVNTWKHIQFYTDQN